MINKVDKNVNRMKRHQRIRNKVVGTADAPRLCIYRSLSHIYAQIINDETGVTLVSASTIDKAVVASKALNGKNLSEQAAVVGAEVAKRALAAGIQKVVFDRGGYLYTGRTKALAEAARSAGLGF